MVFFKIINHSLGRDIFNKNKFMSEQLKLISDFLKRWRKLNLLLNLN